MKRSHPSIRIVCASLLLLMLATLAMPLPSVGAPAKSAGGDRYVTIDFNNVDINVFIKFISELTGKNFIVDQRVKGNVTIISPTKISITEAFKVFESVLEVHGYTTVRAGRVTKILPAPDARTKDIETILKTGSGKPEDKLVTQLVPLTYADPNEIKRLFTPLVSKSSVMAAYAPTNMLIITDIYSNILRLMRIVKEIDIAGVGQEISVIPLQNADSNKIVGTLNSVFKAAPATKKGAAIKTIKFVADERTNTVIVLASEVDTARVRQLIRLLDRETPQGKEKIRVYYLENAIADELAKVLQDVPTKGTPTIKGKATTPVISQNVRITADKPTNSLVITADPDDYLVLEDIIKRLDIARPMVYIEALFMEVDVQKQFDLGTEWTAAGETTISGDAAAVGGGFNLGKTSSLPGLVQGGLPPGFSMGVFSEVIEIAGVNFSSLTALIQFFKQDQDINILQTPQILTTENEEAKINVGKNVPFQTSVSTSNNDTFNSFEYRDVGTILTITPNISKGRMVRLNIGLEISTLEDPEVTTLQPTTLKRTLDTTVVVKDKSTIVIGGLIEDTTAVSVTKVPLLGDIPILGWLFKYRKERNEKTNLYVFLTPHVINSPEEAEGVYGRKRGHIEGFREEKIKLFDDNKEKSEPTQIEPNG